MNHSAPLLLRDEREGIAQVILNRTNAMDTFSANLRGSGEIIRERPKVIQTRAREQSNA